MNKTILLTGATGFLGTQVARELLQETDGTVLALVRGEDQEGATHRLRRAWWDWPELVASIGERVRVLCGDVSQPKLGLDDVPYAQLVRQVTHIIHSAADLRLVAPLDELRATNVRGTEHVLALARAAHRDHGLSRLAHVSTAYVAGGRYGAVPEEALTDAFGFSSAYEVTKYEAEMLVQAAKDDLPVSVFRPGMIVGHSQNGEIKTFNTLYYPLRLYLMGQLTVVPTSPRAVVNLVPVDYVAQSVVQLTFRAEAAGHNFHLTAPHASLPTVAELLEFVRRWAREHLDLQLPHPLCVPLPLRRGQFRPESPQKPPAGRWATLKTLLPYMAEGLEFRRENVDRLLGPYQLDWREFLPRLLDYAVYHGFMHRDERTVHEQIIYRLGSNSRPVTYHDVIEGQVVTRDTAQVRRDMLTAAAALRALGVEPGDRVAIVGLNSTRYLTLEVAIGLVGAISVPLYYTSPPAELDHILASSRARLLLVGALKILQILHELQSDIPVVSFCRGEVTGGSRLGVMGWEPFLALAGTQGNTAASAVGVSGGRAERAVAAPVDLGALATLRYTSGTTGQPKGVMYRHDQLRWVGQSLASVLPWHARTRRVSYLSFLPLSHVVEGMLATYAPYYVPAPLDIYFLEDFRQLQRTLPRVRPTIFFSVPRLYEKVWDAVVTSPLGKLYFGMQEGPARRMLRPLLRLGCLRKAGLDRCAQLIVGSAPAGEGTLRGLQSLGIEVHNAYGLTEAPLVTLSRLGANKIGAAGTPLPSTEIRIAEDGEVLVRGPQVMAGYYGLRQEEAPLRDGWLLTGDLGRRTVEGDLVLQGRKKELIKTSYGKYVQLTKVEALLRDIPGVAEAMVVGEQKPYCAAILWTQGHAQDPAILRTIDRAIVQVNAHLAHPEQVKRWAILPYDLSIERGDLTACLKLKRHSVAQRLQAVVDALYATSKAGAPDVASPVLKPVSHERAGAAEAPAQVVYPMHLGQAQQGEAA